MGAEPFCDIGVHRQSIKEGCLAVVYSTRYALKNILLTGKRILWLSTNAPALAYIFCIPRLDNCFWWVFQSGMK